MINLEEVIRQAESRINDRKSQREGNIEELENLEDVDKFDWTKIENATRLAERAKRLGLYEDAGALMKDPEDTDIGNRIYEKIIGANNLIGISFLFEGARMANAVCRIVIPVSGGKKLGTGFMVSSRVMMTNNHVISDRNEASNATLEFDFFEREDNATGPVTRFKLQPQLLFVTDVRLDFSLIAVEPVNENGINVADRGWFPLIGPSGKAVVGERVSIIQHPNGDPQKITIHDNKLVDIDFKNDFLLYKTDTMGGSSGSPVLNINWDLVALHHAAIKDNNEGIRISSIVKRLQQIFSNESTDSDINLVNELLSSRPPSNIPTPDSHNGNNLPGINQPHINPDGSVSWVVPINLTLGVGHSTLQDSGITGLQPRIDITKTPDPEIPIDDSDLTDATKALDETEGKVYYDAQEDNQAKQDYYPDLNNLDKTQLYDRLSKLVTDTHTNILSYKTARLKHLYPWIDRREGENHQLMGIYSNKVFDALEVIRQEAIMERKRDQALQARMNNEALEPVDEAFLEELEASHPFNCEHVVPQSWFEKKKPPKTDLHHLFTCEWGCNSFRGNRAYFDFETEAFREDCGELDDSKFEPKSGKGAAARATLYFLLRYPGLVSDSNKEMPKERLNTIIKWAQEDNIDTWELHRNAEIHKIQGNRNPLIDFPGLVNEIDFERGWA